MTEDRSDSAAVRVARSGAVAAIEIDSPPVNAASQAVRAGLIAALRDAARDPAIAAIVLTGTGKTFVAGADIREFDGPPVEPHLPDVCNAIEDCPKPVVAALNGAALGGGCELALAAHARIVAEGATLGLPEVKLGLIPGSGGTQRLPRLADAAAAFEMAASGRNVQASEAARLGIVDAVVPLADLRGEAVRLAESLAGKRPAPDLGPSRAPGRSGSVRGREGQGAGARSRPGCPGGVGHGDNGGARRRFRRRLRGRAASVPGVARLGSVEGDAACLFRGAPVGPPAGTQGRRAPARRAHRHRWRGNDGFGHCRRLSGGGLRGGACRSGRGRARTRRQAHRRHRAEGRGPGRQPRQGRRLDARQRIRGLRRLRSHRRGGVRGHGGQDRSHGRTCPDRARERRDRYEYVLSRCQPARCGDGPSAGRDRPAFLRARRNHAPCRGGARGGKRARCDCNRAQVARRLGKLPVVAGVCDGFIGNRILSVYRREMEYALEDGALPWEVDAALGAYGFAMGPFAVSDLSGLDIAWARRKRLAATRDPAGRYVAVADRLCELGRFGRKTGSGWYKYEGTKRLPDPEVAAIVEEERRRKGIAPRAVAADEIQSRARAAIVNEATRILEEGIAASPSDIDLVLVNGYGYPVWRGGPMFDADRAGLGEVLTDIEWMCASNGAGFEPAALLYELVSRGETFADWAKARGA